MASIFCLNCGNRLTTGTPEGDGVERLHCVGCGHIHYENPKILVACILYHRGKLLWMQRALGPYAGLWGIPGGFMERGETVQETACREVREETCLVLDPSSLGIYGVLSVPRINEVYISLIAPLPSMEFATTREASDLRLMSEAEVTLYPRAFSPGTDPLIRELYARLRTGAFKSTPGVLMQIR